MWCLAELIAWVANVCFVVGAVLVIEKRALGLALQAVGNGLYIMYAAAHNSPALGCLSFVLFLVAVLGYGRWRAEEVSSD